MIKDRRTGEERRTEKRHAVYMDIEWEGTAGRHKGQINDLGLTSCFILCSGEVEDGETIKVIVPVSDGMKVYLWGEVVNHVVEIGFALRFIDLNEAQTNFLKEIVKKAEE